MKIKSQPLREKKVAKATGTITKLKRKQSSIESQSRISKNKRMDENETLLQNIPIELIQKYGRGIVINESNQKRKESELKNEKNEEKNDESIQRTKKNQKKSRILKSQLSYLEETIQDTIVSGIDAEILLPNQSSYLINKRKNDKIKKHQQLSLHDLDSELRNSLIKYDEEGEEIDLSPEGMRQREIINAVDLNTARNAFTFNLPEFGPYAVDYTRNGRYLIFGGRKGHVATYDCHKMRVVHEMQLQQAVHDVQYLHNETMFAVAQKNYVYIYDRDGVEIHCMQKHAKPLRLDYLPYHFLLVSVSQGGFIRWHDISIGDSIAGFYTGLGPCRTAKQNLTNAVMHIGHTNGVVSLWSPSIGKPLVSILAHQAPITDLAIDREGHYMATTALDGYLKVWDARKFVPIYNYKLFKPATCVDISERGLLAYAMGRRVEILQDAFISAKNQAFPLYLRHDLAAPDTSYMSAETARKNSKLSKAFISSLSFRPLEDVLAIGHSYGISTMIVPGSGEPNYDSYENNPFISAKQRREAEVENLLNKLSPEMIQLDSSVIGGVEKDAQTLKKEHEEIFRHANSTLVASKAKDRKRGRNKISAKLRRRQRNVIDDQVVKLKAKQEEERKARETNRKQNNQTEREESGALARFKK